MCAHLGAHISRVLSYVCSPVRALSYLCSHAFAHACVLSCQCALILYDSYHLISCFVLLFSYFVSFSDVVILDAMWHPGPIETTDHPAHQRDAAFTHTHTHPHDSHSPMTLHRGPKPWHSDTADVILFASCNTFACGPTTVSQFSVKTMSHPGRTKGDSNPRPGKSRPHSAVEADNI